MEASQTSFAYDDKQIKTLVKAISLERLYPYLARTRDDKWLAIHLYNRNTELSKELYGVLQTLEVLLRNCLHTALMEKAGSESWYFTLQLRDGELSDIEQAEQEVSAGGVNSTWLLRRQGALLHGDNGIQDFVVRPGRVIAALSFGFWVKLCANAYQHTLWPVIAPRFPRYLDRTKIHDRLMELKTLRNRIAHHETLIKRNRQADYDNLLETIGWLSPVARGWAESENRFLDVLHRTLPKKLKTPVADTDSRVMQLPSE